MAFKGAETMDIKNRLKKAEKIQEREPPLDLIGRYYDTLTQAEKRRFWKYVYGDTYTLEQAERLEEKYISGTLHFTCELKPGGFSFPELDAFDAAISRMNI